MNENFIQVDDGGGRGRNIPVDLPSNSITERRAKRVNGVAPSPEGEKRAETIYTGEVIRRKTGFARRLREALANEVGPDGIRQTFVKDILIGAAKAMVLDAVVQTFSIGKETTARLLYGDSPVVRYGGRTNYNQITSSRISPVKYNTISARGRAEHDFGQIIIPNRAVAEEALRRLRVLIDEYEVARVADLYDVIGITHDFPDRAWGWYNLDDAYSRRTRGGFILMLPPAEHIED